ncbi:uncharacterized protein LOC122387928 [Amphibalanus amphitrite]|uniref:uncharacterized protein LOC122387928 n=1 Tax=Amphibalanus amphitrite TaxID=1232801 RepID=UPI001C92A6FB|nr:uncharacterized protein LOC122387928 [Amphibalanus amphitrite]
MKLLVVALLCAAVSRGQPAGWSGALAGWQRWSRAATSPHTFADSIGRSARSQSALLGVTDNQYRYIDAEGTVRTVKYWADTPSLRSSGAHTQHSPQLRMAAPAPAPVQDTPEVAAAKAQFLATFRMAQQGVIPAPVQDTPEVAAAKAEFMAKFRAAQRAQRKRRSVTVGLSHTPASTALLPGAYWSPLY